VTRSPASRPPSTSPAFTQALRHINAVLDGEAQLRLLALATALITARALHDLAAA
jgi:hypothetical protein